MWITNRKGETMRSLKNPLWSKLFGASVILFCCGFLVVTGDFGVSHGPKRNYGHYVTLSLSETDEDRSIMKTVAQLPGVAGVQKRYLWSALETEQGVYDFSEISKDLDAIRSVGKQLIIFIMDRSFEEGEVIVPAYIPWAPTPTGTMAVRWNPVAIAGFTALYAAIGEAFDADPNFEGVAMQESATGLTAEDQIATGYSVPVYRDALIAIITGGIQALPTSRFFWYMNFIQYPSGQPEEETEALRAILDAVSQYDGVVAGGPDLLPESEALLRRTYPLYPEYKDEMDLFCSAQYDSFRHLHVTNTYSYTTKYWTPEEIFLWGKTNLHIKYMLWTYKTWHSPADDYIFEDAKPVIENNPVFNSTPEE
jgi:hypothetical protein